MSNSGSDSDGRRPAPRRPTGKRPATRKPVSRPTPAPDDDDDDEKTQALNIADFGALLDDAPSSQLLGESDKTMTIEADELRARFASQFPDGAPAVGDRTLVGHPAIGGRSSGAVKGAQPKRHNQTLAMASPLLAPAVSAALSEDDDDEATQALNLDAMLADIDGAASAPAALLDDSDDDDDEATQAVNLDAMLADIDGVGAPSDDEDDDDEATQAVNLDAMLAQIDDSGDDDDIEEDEATQAVNLDDMLSEIDGGSQPASFDDEEDDDEKTQALDLSMVEAIDSGDSTAPAKAKSKVEKIAAAATSASAKVTLPKSASDSGAFFGTVAYALSYEGNCQKLDDAIAAGSGDVQSLKTARAAMDLELAKKGWINLAASAGGVTLLLTVLGLAL